MITKFFDEIFQPDDNPMTLHERTVYGQHWKWIFFSGILFIFMGFFSFAIPPVSTISLTITLGGILLVSGLVYLTQVIEFRHARGSVTRLFQASLAIVIASIMFQYPREGLQGLSLTLSFYFLIGAVLKWIFFSEIRPHGGWSWGIISSITSFILGLYIVAVFPYTSLGMPGAFLGIDLLISGSGMMGFALSVQKHHAQIINQDIHRDQDVFGHGRRSPVRVRR